MDGKEEMTTEELTQEEMEGLSSPNWVEEVLEDIELNGRDY